MHICISATKHATKHVLKEIEELIALQVLSFREILSVDWATRDLLLS